MLAELDVVRLRTGLSAPLLAEGALGTVLEVLGGLEGQCLVEFSDDEGQELATVLLTEAQLERVWHRVDDRGSSERQAA